MRTLTSKAARVALATLAVTIGTASIAVAGTRGEGSSQQFQQFGPATDAVDPENPDNDVLQVDTTAAPPVGVFRNMNELVGELDNQLGFKYFMQDRDCGGGSPRIVLFVDVNESGQIDGGDTFLNGHVQPISNCVPEKWVYQDLTDDLPRWEVLGAPVPGVPGPYAPWEAVEGPLAGFTVLAGMLVEDSQSFKQTNEGIAYYDLISIGNHTYEDRTDSTQN